MKPNIITQTIAKIGFATIKFYCSSRIKFGLPAVAGLLLFASPTPARLSLGTGSAGAGGGPAPGYPQLASYSTLMTDVLNHYFLLYSFTADDGRPAPYGFGPVTFCNGLLYGTSNGGIFGRVYKCNPGYVFGVPFDLVHQFTDSPDGSDAADCFLVAGWHVYSSPQPETVQFLFGTTLGGGTPCCGTVFEIKNSNHGVDNYHQLNSGIGIPQGLALSAVMTHPYEGGALFLYGTSQGGLYGDGKVFGVDENGNSMTLHDFNGYADPTDGNTPGAPVIAYGDVSIDGDDTALFGTTISGGIFGGGTLFRIYTVGLNSTRYDVLHYFGSANDGISPKTPLVMDRPQNINQGDEVFLYGIVYSNTAALLFREDVWGNNYSILYTIPMCGYASLTLQNKMLYGTAMTAYGYYGNSWLFKIKTDGTGYNVLHTFNDNSVPNDGWNCYGPLTFVTGTNEANPYVFYDVLYGTTPDGGLNGNGTIFGMPVNTRTTIITSPANGAVIPVPANITITANATDSDGTGISRVDFYQGTTLIGTATAAPYSVIWNNVQPGTYTLAAVATDDNGAVTPSAPVTFIADAPPTASITSPSSGTFFTPPANITITANAADSDGTVTRVDFIMDGSLVGSAHSAPYSCTVPNVPSCGNTPHLFMVRAKDNYGVVTPNYASTAVSVIVDAPPTVSITSPANGAVFSAPANMTISANAADSDGRVNAVFFYRGTTLIGTATTAPYSVPMYGVQAGTYTLTAKAIDNWGQATTSSAITVQVH